MKIKFTSEKDYNKFAKWINDKETATTPGMVKLRKDIKELITTRRKTEHK